jgi:cytidyltransferase-like protein
LRTAKTYGHNLIVAVTRDAFVNKGPRRPVFNEKQRVEMLRELRCVDMVILVDSAMQALETIKPHIFVKGGDYKNRIEPEHYRYCQKHGIEIAFTNEPHYSSTDLLHFYDRPEPRQ